MTPHIVAHRGDMECFPENTLVSFTAAQEKGADTIELDIHSTSDGVPVVCHDYTLERTTNGRGVIAGRSSQYIQQLDAGSWYDQKFSTERVPTLEEVFALFGRGIQYEIEVRSCEILFLEKVIDLIQTYDVKKNVEITSPHPYVLTWLKSKANVRTGMFVTAPPEWMSQQTAQTTIIGNALLGKVSTLHYPVNMLSEARENKGDFKIYAT